MLPARALRTIRKHGLFPTGARVLVAVSGGADSVALLHVLRVLERRGLLTVAGIGHLNHQLRGTDADADEQFCREIATRESLPIEVGRADVVGLAASRRQTIEHAARTARYAFLEAAADRLGAEVIAVGHTLDDQAETVLLRLFRGAGPRGLAGIRPRSGRIVRPLLDVRRADLRRYAAAHRLSFREDETNQDTRMARNRVRLEVLPWLEQHAPGLPPVLARLAARAREDEDYLSLQAIAFFDRLVLQTAAGVDLDVPGLREAPAPMAARVVRDALEQVAAGRFVGAAHVERVLELTGADEGASVALPGCTAMRQGLRIVLGRWAPRALDSRERQPLPVPGGVAFGSWRVSTERLTGVPPGGMPPGRGPVALVAAEALRGPLAVRSRAPGDRFRPLGMGGRARKLQDFLVDRKVARADRDALPLVVDRDDRIVWVAGQAVAEDFRVTEPSQPVILLTARQLGGLG